MGDTRLATRIQDNGLYTACQLCQECAVVKPPEWIFFCSEQDYPKFRALIPEYPLFNSPTYFRFVAVTEGQIERDHEQVERQPITVSYEKFMAFRYRPDNGGRSDKEILDRYTCLVWGGQEQ